MALTESIPLDPLWQAPSFELYNAEGKLHTLHSLMGSKGLVVVFTCNHCPYAKAIWERLIDLHLHFKDLGIPFVAINPNINPAYPQDSPPNMLELIKKLQIPFPYLVDTNQEVAKSFQAKCTPDIFLLKADSRIFYHGRLDDCWKDSKLATKHDLKEALQLLSSDQPPLENSFPSMGCSIKWC